MFTKQTPDAPIELDEIIDKVLAQLSDADCGTNEYGKLVAQLTALYKIRENDITQKLKIIDSLRQQEETAARESVMCTEAMLKENEAALKSELLNVDLQLKKKELENHGRLSKETIAVIAANLVGIVLIIGHERLNVITSKALSFIMKPK